MSIHEDLVVIQNVVSNLVLNKPVYVGFSVLELSKLPMYSVHYDKMLPQYDTINLCLADTDSLLYEVIYPLVATRGRTTETEYLPRYV